VADRGRVGADGAPENAAAHRLLLAATPTLKSGDFAAADGGSAVAFAVRIANGIDGAGVRVVGVDHDGNRNSSTEEVEVVGGLVARLIAPGAQWIDEWGVVAQMTAKDVLVVAPYNAQVSRLAERLAATGVRAGTVDKFQGQQAPVVIYSMATSRPEDAPRGMEFAALRGRVPVASADEAGECALPVSRAGAVGARCSKRSRRPSSVAGNRLAAISVQAWARCGTPWGDDAAGKVDSSYSRSCRTRWGCLRDMCLNRGVVLWQEGRENGSGNGDDQGAQGRIQGS